MKKDNQRGMSKWRDWIDWIGGYPFEVAKPEEIFGFYRDRGMGLIKMRTQGGSLGCNEFVFIKGMGGYAIGGPPSPVHSAAGQWRRDSEALSERCPKRSIAC